MHAEVEPSEATTHKHPIYSHSAKDHKNKTVEQKILYQFMIIIAFFLGCWIVLSFIWLVAPFGWRISNIHLDGFIGMFCHINSAANPMVYGLMNKNLREAMSKEISPRTMEFLSKGHQVLKVLTCRQDRERKVSRKRFGANLLGKVSERALMKTRTRVTTGLTLYYSTQYASHLLRSAAQIHPTGAASSTRAGSGGSTGVTVDSRRTTSASGTTSGGTASFKSSAATSMGSSSSRKSSAADISKMESEVDFHDDSWITKAHDASSRSSVSGASGASGAESMVSVIESTVVESTVEQSTVEVELPAVMESVVEETQAAKPQTRDEQGDEQLQKELALEAGKRMMAMMKADRGVTETKNEDDNDERGQRGTGRMTAPRTSRGTFAKAVDFFKGDNLEDDKMWN